MFKIYQTLCVLQMQTMFMPPDIWTHFRCIDYAVGLHELRFYRKEIRNLWRFSFLLLLFDNYQEVGEGIFLVQAHDVDFSVAS